MTVNKYPDVCISAGHGLGSRESGHIDPGANIVGSTNNEDDVVLNLSRRLVADLKVVFSKGHGEVFLRNAGHYSTADDFAVRSACDLFLELHLNSGGGAGTEVLFNAPVGSRTFRLAVDMSDIIADAYSDSQYKMPNRGAKYRDDLAVLRRHTGLTSLLIELWFADNKRDLAAHRRNYRKAELAIINRILQYYGWKQVKSLPRNWTRLQKSMYKPY